MHTACPSTSAPGGVSANAPPRYGWLGGPQRSADTLGGTILMGVRVYHPATGRFLTTDPTPGGNATAYDYCTGDPVNCRDLDGNWGWRDVLARRRCPGRGDCRAYSGSDRHGSWADIRRLVCSRRQLLEGSRSWRGRGPQPGRGRPCGSWRDSGREVGEQGDLGRPEGCQSGSSQTRV